jgi:hypothetical protein
MMLVSGLALFAPFAYAQGYNYSYEAVRYYADSGYCGSYYDGGLASLTNAVTNGEGFANTLSSAGYTTSISSWENSAVYNTDTCDSDIADQSMCGDWLYTDTDIASLFYYNTHGTCGYWYTWGASCTPGGTACPNTDAGAQQLCDQFNDKCFPFDNSGAAITCSPDDQAIPSEGEGDHYVSYFSMYWGESTSWAGAGTNGNIDDAVLDMSCPFQASWWMWKRQQTMFAGAHILLGYTSEASGSDFYSSPNRGANFAANIAVDDDYVNYAWHDAVWEDSAYVEGDICTVGLAMDGTNSAAENRLPGESWGDPFDATGNYY